MPARRKIDAGMDLGVAVHPLVELEGADRSRPAGLDGRQGVLRPASIIWPWPAAQGAAQIHRTSAPPRIDRANCLTVMDFGTRSEPHRVPLGVKTLRLAPQKKGPVDRSSRLFQRNGSLSICAGVATEEKRTKGNERSRSLILAAYFAQLPYNEPHP